MGWIWWVLVVVAFGAVLRALRGARDQVAVELEFWLIDPEGGGMAGKITELAIEIGQTKRFRVKGVGKAGQDRSIEDVQVAVGQNPERYTASVSGDVVTVVSALLPGDEPVTAEDGTVTPGIGDADATLAGSLAVKVDVRIGEGVKTLEKTLPIVGHVSEASDLEFEELEDA